MSIWTIHETDLYHPHADPDDHWDIACQFALYKLGHISLEGVMLDYPEDPTFGDPGVMPVSQLNVMTGKSVPIGIGMPREKNKRCPEKAGSIELLLRTLERAPEKVTMHIVGSCRDVAAACKMRPDLFRDKVKALYLNAGSAFESEVVEYNVLLDPEAYAAIFALPCPVYWMPCFHTLSPAHTAGDSGLDKYYGTYYLFRQDEILPELSPEMQNFFMFALSRSADNQWLKVMNAPVNPEHTAYFGARNRNMWCTGGFLHAAGLKATCAGEIVSLDAPEEAAYGFVPVKLSCDEKGHVEWAETDEPTDRYIYCVHQPKAYGPSLTTAMKNLLKAL